MQRALGRSPDQAAAWRYLPAFGIGAALIFAAIVVLVDVSMVVYFSAKLIAWAAIVIGAFDVVIALFRRPWAHSAPRALLGALYFGFGLAFLQHTEFRSAFLIYVLATALIGSGVVRLFLGFARQVASKWLLVSGAVGTASGLAILLNWVSRDDRTIGLLLGIDLLIHGLAWLAWARATTRGDAHAKG